VVAGFELSISGRFSTVHRGQLLLGNLGREKMKFGKD